MLRTAKQHKVQARKPKTAAKKTKKIAKKQIHKSPKRTNATNTPTTTSNTAQDIVVQNQNAVAPINTAQNNAVGPVILNEPRWLQDPILKNRPAHEIDVTVNRITEEKVHSLIIEHKRKKQSRMYRLSEQLRDHESQVRAFILAVPAAIVMWGAHDASLYASSLIDNYTQDAELTSNALMLLGAAQAGLAGWLFKSANKILSLAGQPSEPVIKEIIKLSLKNQKLHDIMGGKFKIGHFSTVSTIPGELRINDTKAQHYQEWLNFQQDKFTQPIPEIPFPRFMQRYLSAFPAFQTSTWNAAVAEKVAADLQQNPQDYLSESSSEESEDNQQNNNNNNNDQTAIAKKAKQIDDADSEDNVDPKDISNIAIDETLDPEVRRAVNPTQYDSQTGLKHIPRQWEVTSYSGYERLWKPRRLQFATHLVGPNDEGMLIAEVEKFQFGPGSKHASGLLQYNVCQFVSLKTGQVTTLTSKQERPSLLTHAHVKKLFDTLPPDQPNVERHHFDYIVIEDLKKEETDKILALESKKTGVGIYH